MLFSTEFYVQIAVYILSFGTMFGTFKTELNHMKMDIAEIKALNIQAMKQQIKDIKEDLNRLEREIHEKG